VAQILLDTVDTKVRFPADANSLTVVRRQNMKHLIISLLVIAAPAVAAADATANQLPEPSILGLIAAGVVGAGIGKWLGKKNAK
jgi:hypothetical protein